MKRPNDSVNYKVRFGMQKSLSKIGMYSRQDQGTHSDMMSGFDKAFLMIT